MSNKAITITITIAIRITELRCCSPQVSYLIVDEADNDMDMGKVFFLFIYHHRHGHFKCTNHKKTLIYKQIKKT